MTEDQLEQETLGWLASVGYSPLNARDLDRLDPRLERSDLRTVVLERELKQSLRQLNPKVPTVAIDDAFNQLLAVENLPLIQANRQLHRLLVNGVPVQYQSNHETVGDLVRVIDWDQPAANTWIAVQQFTIKGPKHTRRPDIILFINGLPLVLMELKNPADIAADIWMAFDQLQTYKEQIPDVFAYNELLVISDGSLARVGSLSSNRERFMQWRTIDGVELDPLGQFRELEVTVAGLLSPPNLLHYLRHFVLFEDDGIVIKKTAGYHQFHAVRAAVEKVFQASTTSENALRGKGGVVWHTTGSGKSITMTCFAACLLKDIRLENPTIIVVTDRNDLDGQLFGVFGMNQDLLREEPVQATTRTKLRELLTKRPAGGIIFTTIQKFMLGEDEDTYPTLCDRRNVVVIADEAHRTQYGFQARLKSRSATSVLTTDGKPPPALARFAPEESESTRYVAGYAQHLRDALPNATFVAFTGTPISTTDRDTQAVFGEHIHVYDMQQAQQDGATVAIYYESRLAKLGLDEAELTALDEDIDELAEDEEESAQAKLKQRWSALEKVVGAAPRIAQVAEDLVQHFEERSEVQYGKAMIAAMSREICVHLYNEIVKLRPQWHDDDPEKGEIKIVMTGSASDKALLRPHIYPSLVKKRLEKRFKDPGDPLKLVIVRDMWLTGFDAPCVHTLYVDKPIKGLNLIQAISRVNRVFKDKQGGLVVDYIGIGEDLKAAMKTYAANKGKGRPTVDSREALAIVLERMDILRAMLHGFDYTNFRTGGHRILAGAANHVLGLPSINDEDPKRRFADHALALSHAFSLCCTLAEARELRDEIAFMQAVKVILTKPAASGKRLTDEEKDYAVRQIINSAVVSIGVVDIFESVGLEKPNIGLLDEAFLTQVRNLPEKNLAVELLERLLQGEIKSRFKTNIIQDRKFSEMLSEVIRRYQNRSIETAQVIEELIELAKKFREASNRGESLGLSADEEKFYDALAANESAVRELKDEILKKIAQELTEGLRKNLTVDWAIRESVRAKLRIMIRRILKKYRYPPDQQESAVDLVLQQAETVGEEMMPKT